MVPQRNQPIPLIGRGGVQLVTGDALIGFIALPLAALLREVLSAMGSRRSDRSILFLPP